MIVDSDNDLEGQITEWRAYMHHRRELLHTDAEELEDHTIHQADHGTGKGGGTMIVDSDNELEGQIAEWLAYMHHHRELLQTDAEELEDHLRSRISDLTEAGLRADEAFLIAVKRMGSLDELSREFAREHSERLWKQLV